MPRPLHIRKDMSKGWEALNSLRKIELSDKVKYSEKLIASALSQYSSPVVCWSGGKDSTVVLDLVRKHWRDIPVIFIKSGIEFNETYDYIDKYSRDNNLNLHISESNYNFWDIGEQHGWPIFGKSISSNVQRARSTGNIRKNLSKLEIRLVESDIKISNKCNFYLQEKPGKEKEKELKADAKFIGIRADESRARSRLWVDHGDNYFVKRYYKRGEGIWKINPIAIWSETDVWQYLHHRKIPTCELYDKGLTRNGCWPCAMAIRNGQLHRLKHYDEKLFYFLMTETGLGQEIIKFHKLLRGGRFPRMIPNVSLLRNLLDEFI